MANIRYNIAVVGATGLVGAEMLKILEERDFPVDSIKLLASERSAGSFLEFKGKEEKVNLLSEETFDGIDFALFSPGAAVSKIYAPVAADAGCIVIDNTSQFRMEPDIPLVVPEVNPEAIADYQKRNIIANPNCSTIQLVVALMPIHKQATIKRVVVSTYQAVSGAGKEAIDELSGQTMSIFNMQNIEKHAFSRQIAFNCIPQIDIFMDDDYTKEELKMANETRKIMDDASIRVTSTAVRVPVFIGHSEAVNIETKEKITVQEVRNILSSAPGLRVIDDPQKGLYPTALDSSGRDDVLVGRIREDVSIPNGINMWIVADNLRKGAALNAVQIAETLINKHF